MMNSKWCLYCTVLLIALVGGKAFSQSENSGKSEGSFMDQLKFGGRVGLSVSSEYKELALAPQAVYKIDDSFSAGLGFNYTYIKERNLFRANSYGISLLGFYNPVNELQLSAELNQSKYNFKFEDNTFPEQEFWDTALFLGVGYNGGDVVFGLQYDVLFDRDRSPNGSPLMPFIRVFF